MPDDRLGLEQSWLHLRRVTLPGLSALRGWPVREDHCFQRILLDALCGGAWYDHVKDRPAYQRMEIERLAAAVTLGQSIAAGDEDLRALNAQSLAWRRGR
ncbi:MAG: GCN5-related N-acetyltransferase [Pseudomonadota bacterium]|nr:GCN5-related N-acetyltransferase [Pseudomonadota bacterium]